MKINRIIKAALLLALTTGLTQSPVYAQEVDATSMEHKVMAGYQGWFRTPGDTTNNTRWTHLFNSQSPEPASLAFDTWPDMSELGENEKYPVPGFSYQHGEPAYLYSAQNYRTVLRHFEWMKTYGIDGVWLSEFCGHFPGGHAQSDSTAVLNIMHNVQRAAQKTGRTWAFMWDMSGLGGGMTKTEIADIIVRQWKKMVDQGITTDDRYLHDHGKPVLLIWGFFPNRPASQPDFMNPVLDFLLAPGKYQATLVGGVDNTWRTKGTPEFQKMLMHMQGLQPWSVGRRNRDTVTGHIVQNTSEWEEDIRKCRANHVLFMPVFNAGTHIAGPPPIAPLQPLVPRRTGYYLWEQFVRASQTGINSAFVAMFDEINEGTQIMKIDIHPPVQASFLTYDGATADYYLRLTGAGAKLLKTGKPIEPVIPISPFSPAKWYQLRNLKYAMLLNDQPVKSTDHGQKILQEEASWQLNYDGKGYFTIKNKRTQNWLGCRINSTSLLLANKLAGDIFKWKMEWDGTGTCQLINKATGKSIAGSADGTKMTYLPHPATDELRWSVIEL